jgi:hypothetical protein
MKQEPKQRLEKYSERFDNKDNELVEGIFNPDTWGKRRVDDTPKQETTLEEVAIIYAHNSFVWPLNKQREKQSIPPGQLVPSGYAKHQKIATKHFTNGAKWQQERSYSEEELYSEIEWLIISWNNDGTKTAGHLTRQIIEQLKKK